MSYLAINHSLMLSFLHLLGSSQFNRKSNCLELLLKYVLIGVEKASIPAARNITSKIEKRMSLRKTQFKKAPFLTSGCLVL